MRWTIFAICSWIKWEENVYSIPKLNGWLSSCPRYIRDFSFLISYETDLRIFLPFLLLPNFLDFQSTEIHWWNEKKNRKFFNIHSRYLVYVNFVVYYCYLKCEQKLRTLCVVDIDVDIVTEMFFFLFLILTFFFLSWTHQKFFNIEQIIGRKKTRIFYSLNNGHTRLK